MRWGTAACHDVRYPQSGLGRHRPRGRGLTALRPWIPGANLPSPDPSKNYSEGGTTCYVSPQTPRQILLAPRQGGPKAPITLVSRAAYNTDGRAVSTSGAGGRLISSDILSRCPWICLPMLGTRYLDDVLVSGRCGMAVPAFAVRILEHLAAEVPTGELGKGINSRVTCETRGGGRHLRSQTFPLPPSKSSKRPRRLNHHGRQ